jgi:1-acyl-sn-glycerol-3-phosphate acyltransferase
VLLVRLSMRIVLFICGFYWVCCSDLRSKSAAPRAPIIVANHIGMMDAFLIFVQTGCAAAGKAELFKLPLVGRILSALQCIRVDRKSSAGRARAKAEIVERATNDEPWPRLLVFPEGTTSQASVLTMFKAGYRTD